MSKNYVELKVSDLREECKKRNLEATGLKVHLVERLNKYDKDIQIIENAKISERKSGDQAKDVNNSNGNNDGVDLKVDKSINEESIKKSPIKAVTKVKVQSLFERATFEPDSWESRTDMHLDFYNSDLNLIIEPCGFSAEPISDNGFENMFGGVKANYGVKSGKVYYEVKILKKNDIHLENDFGESNMIKLGWSVNNSSLSLGEELLSFGFDCYGKKSTNNVSTDYGIVSNEGDIIGCFLEFNDNAFIISFSVNGDDQGEAFYTEINDLGSHFLLPHIYVRNIAFEVNFGVNREGSFPPKTDNMIDLTWSMIGKVEPSKLIRTCYPPKSKAECEVLMMCGLPSCGKTTWVDKTTKNDPNKFYNVLSTNVILDKMKVMNLRKKCAGSRWDSFIQTATLCLNKLMEIAVTRRRNFILDQTNVYPTAQRRRMKTFEEFIRKAIIIVPTDDEYQRRMNQVVTEEGKDVPESAVLQMKENFVIPEENSDLFKEIVFIELQRSDAEDLVKKYNEEAKTKKNAEKEEHGNNKRSDREEDSYGRWNDSPKRSDHESSGPPVSKKSRWNEDHTEEKSTKPSRDHHGSKGSSTSHSTRKNEYKGGFCFDREADDTDKTGRGNYRSEERHEPKDRSRSKDGRGDKYGSRSGGDRDRDSRRERGDRDRDRDRDDDRRGRSRDRVSEQRGGYGQSRDRSSTSRGGYNDRRPSNNAYDGGDSRGKFSQNNYGSSSGSSKFGGGTSSNYESHEPRASHFQVGQPIERGRGRGGASDIRGGHSGRGGYQPKYSEFIPQDTTSVRKDPNYEEYDYKSPSGYDRPSAPARGGFGQPRQAASAAGGRWGGSIPSNDYQGYKEGGNNNEDEAYYSAYFDNNQAAPVVDSGRPSYGASKVPTEHKPASRFGPMKTSDQVPKFANPYDTSVVPPSMGDISTKVNNPYEAKTNTRPTSRFANKIEDTPQFTNPYDGAYKDTNKPTNPYEAKAGGAASSYKGSDDQAKFVNPYDSKSASYQTGGYGAPVSTGAILPTKYTPQYGSKSGPSTGAYGAPSQSMQALSTGGDYEDYQSYESTNQNTDYDDYYANEATQAYSAKPQSTGQFKAPTPGSFKAPITGAYNPTAKAFNNATKAPYNAQNTGAYSQQQTSSYASPSSGSYGAQQSGAYGAQSGVAYNTTPSGANNAQQGGSFNTQASGAYTTQATRPYNSQPATGYSAQQSGAYNAPSSVAYSSQSTGAYGAQTNAGYGTQSSGAYNTQQTGGYNTQSTGAYSSQSGGAYGSQTTGLYSTQQGGAYPLQQGGAQSAGGYSSQPSGAQSAGAYNAPSKAVAYPSQQSAAYSSQQAGKNPTQQSGAYDNQSGRAYNAQATDNYTAQSSGVYKTPSSGAYNTTSGAAYNAASGAGGYGTGYTSTGAYNAQQGATAASYNAQQGTSGATYNTSATGGYKAQAGAAANAGGAYGTKQSADAYNSQSASGQYGPYTNTASGAYGSQASNTKSSSSDQYGNPVSAGSFANPYSNCYENPATAGAAASANAPAQSAYDYYGGGGQQRPTNPAAKPGQGPTKPSTDKSGVGQASGGAAAYGDDYSQYYGQY